MKIENLIGPMAFLSVFLIVFGAGMVITAGPKKNPEDLDEE